MVMQLSPVRDQLSNESAALLDVVVQLHAAAEQIILRHAETDHFDRSALAEVATLCTPYLVHLSRAMVLVDLLLPPKEAASCPRTPSAIATAADAIPADHKSPAGIPAANGARPASSTSAPPAMATARPVRPPSSTPHSPASAAPQRTSSGAASGAGRPSTTNRPLHPQPKPATRSSR